MAPFIKWTEQQPSASGTKYTHSLVNTQFIKQATYHEPDGPVTMILDTNEPEGFKIVTVPKGDDARKAIEVLQKLK